MFNVEDTNKYWKNDDLLFGFHGKNTTLEMVLTAKLVPAISRDKFYSKNTSGFAEHQENGTYGLGYVLPPQRKKDEGMRNHRLGQQLEGARQAAHDVLEERIDKIDESWYVSYFFQIISGNLKIRAPCIHSCNRSNIH